MLNARWKLGGHHLLPVQLAPVDNERSVTNSVNHALLLACGIDVCGNRLQHDNVVLLDDVDDLALDVGDALFDQGRPDELGLHGCELELGKLVCVRPRARPYANHLIQQVDGGNCNDALPILSQRREGIIPFTSVARVERAALRAGAPGYRARSNAYVLLRGNTAQRKVNRVAAM